MSRQSYNADAMRDAMEVACQVYLKYGEFEPNTAENVHKLIRERRLPYDDPVFQAAYAAICLERDLPNQYITIHMP